jgi:hypothetical protein
MGVKIWDGGGISSKNIYWYGKNAAEVIGFFKVRINSSYGTI